MGESISEAGDEDTNASQPQGTGADQGQDGLARRKPSFFTPGSRSWTNVIPRTAHNATFLDCDFGPTTLGPIPDWGPALRLYASMLFADSRAACVYWGPDWIAFYNEQFSVPAAGAHPGLMGNAFAKAFPTLSDTILPQFDHVKATGETVDVDNILLFPIRNGFLEEVYFIGQFIPLRGDSGKVEGIYNTVYESTARVLYDRRRAIVDRIAAIPPLPVNETLVSIVDALRGNPNDITMAMLYSLEDLTPSAGPNLQLRGSIGVPDGHPCAPREASLETSDAGLVPVFRLVKVTGKPCLLSAGDGSLQQYQHLFEGIAWCGYGEPSRDIVVLPMVVNANLLGFFVQGTNPRRMYDEPTEMLIIDLSRQMESKWISSISTEEGKTREMMLERRAMDTENRLHHMAQSAPLGMCQIGIDHRIQWANDQFYEITGHDRSEPAMAVFRRVLASEGRTDARAGLQTLLNGAPRRVKEYRLERRWTPPVQKDDEEEHSAWILSMSFPLMEDGKVKLIMAYVTDISHQKWAESIQMRNAALATEAKRRQEEFIDTVSHEMRNPLTAITQLADGIAKCLKGVVDKTSDLCHNIALENVEAAKTILSCAAHQKRVIDDVLLLSRLESEMLSISTVSECPRNIVHDTVRMFDGEVAENGLTFSIREDDSYNDLGISWVQLDPSRLTQILINLISNAIKFTATSTTRKIEVVYGAQNDRPPPIKTQYGEIDWISLMDSQRSHISLPPPPDDVKPLYLYLSVNDTGMGMTPEEIEKLFKRWSQATAKTHAVYGGSGLGLYICRELAEKQGGGVGVASKHGVGSAFGFYIEVRHSEPPAEQEGAENEVRLAQSPRFRVTNASEHDKPDTECKRQQDSYSKQDETSTSSKALSESQSPTAQPKSFQILLVEDNLINQKILAKQLRKRNCTVSVANHGREALEVLEKTDCWCHPLDPGSLPTPPSEDRIPIELILMDWEMPQMNGLDCSKKIRELEQNGRISKHLPIIAITANVRREQQDEAIDAGMDRVLSKPFTVDELMESMREVTEAMSTAKG